MHEEIRFRTPVPIPELEAKPGDFIRYRPDRPNVVYVVKRFPTEAALDAIRNQGLARYLPGRPAPSAPPVGTPRLQLVKGGDDG